MAPCTSNHGHVYNLFNVNGIFLCLGNIYSSILPLINIRYMCDPHVVWYRGGMVVCFGSLDKNVSQANNNDNTLF